MDARQQDPRPTPANGAAQQGSAANSVSTRASGRNVGLTELLAVAIGLGGLYLLVRVRNEAEREPVELDHTHDTMRPGAGGIDLSAWGHTYPHPDNPPAWVRDEDVWEHAKERVRPHWHEYREPWAVVAHVYEQMGGRTV
ncbi:MAG TPA: hypothetical protein VG963_04015 [Polyangiaceae bacterium]|nr:hypothetical protein [Polyangiaceae bacterium]HVZ31564.1 hypothetical protein [Polyangiaceae bacterium]